MKFFKSVRTWIATALCALMCVTGGIAVNELTSKKAIAAETDVEVSADIQTIIDSYNNGLTQNGSKNNYLNVKYVKDHKLVNGTEVSGIMFTIDASKLSSGTTEAINIPTLTVKANTLTATDKLVSFMFAPDAYETSDSSDNSLNGVEFHFLRDDGVGFTYQMNNASENYSEGVYKYTNTHVRRYNGPASYNNIGLYYYASTKASVNYGTRGFNKASFDGQQTTPHSVYYDYATNVLYDDSYASHDSDQYEMIRIFNVDPTTYNSLGSVHPWPNTRPDATRTLVNHDGSKTYYPFEGFTNGNMRVGVRMNVQAGKVGKLILTSFLGLDLTNPQSTFSEGILVADDCFAKQNVDYAIPAPKYQTVIGNLVEKTFEGTVNVYEGERNYTYAYGSLGSTVNSITDDLGAPIYSSKKVNDVLTFSELGKYTLEYVGVDGQTAYSALVVGEGVKPTIVNNNTDILLNGELLTDSDKVIPGDVLKFVAKDGYKLWDYTVNDTSELNQIYKNGGVCALTEDDTYTVTINDLDGLSIRVSSYKNKYAIRLMRDHYKDEKGEAATSYVYEGIDSKEYYYCAYAWKEDGSYYGLYEYNGTQLKFTPTDIWITEGLYLGAGSEVNNYRKTALKTTQNQFIGYYLLNGDTQEKIGYLKPGGGFINVNSDIDVYHLFADTDVQTENAFIKTEGTVGLSVKFRILKHDYEALKSYGIDVSNVTTGVIATDTYVASNTVKNHRIPYRYASLGGGGVKIVSVKNLVEEYETDAITGAEYKVFYLTLSNIKPSNYAKSYHFGAYINISGITGGEIIAFGSSAANAYEESFPCISVLKAAQVGYANISTEDNQKEFVYNVNGENYYTDVYTEDQTKTLVKFYNYGTYLSYVTTEETEGYGVCNYDEVNGIVYYYDTSKINSETDAKRIIKYALEMIG